MLLQSNINKREIKQTKENHKIKAKPSSGLFGPAGTFRSLFLFFHLSHQCSSINISHLKLINKGGNSWKSKKLKNSLESAKATVNTNYSWWGVWPAVWCSFVASGGLTDPPTEQIGSLLFWAEPLVSAIKTCWIMVDTKPWAIRNMMCIAIPGCSLDLTKTCSWSARMKTSGPGASPLLSSFRMAWLSGTWGHCSGLLKPLNHRPQLWPRSARSLANKTSRKSKSFELKKSFRIYVTGTWFGVRSFWTTTSSWTCF